MKRRVRSPSENTKDAIYAFFLQMNEEKELNHLKLKEISDRNVSLMRQMTNRIKGEQGQRIAMYFHIDTHEI